MSILSLGGFDNSVTVEGFFPGLSGQVYCVAFWFKHQGDEPAFEFINSVALIQNTTTNHNFTAGVTYDSGGVNSWVSQSTLFNGPSSGVTNSSCQTPGTWFMIGHNSDGSEQNQVHDTNGLISTQDYVGGTLDGATRLRIGGAGTIYAPPLGYKFNRLAIWTQTKSSVELADIAQNDNILASHSTNLYAFYDLDTDWATTGGQILDSSGNARHITANVNWVYDADRPGLPAFPTPPHDINAFGNDIKMTSIEVGTVHCVRMTSGAVEPTAEQIRDGVIAGDILEKTQRVVGTAPADFTLSFTTGSTFTEYDYWYVLERPDTSLVKAEEVITLTTSGLVTDNLVSAQGIPRASLTGIKFSWFDETESDTLNAPTLSGTFDTDASGDFTISLPGSALTATQTGRLVINDGVETASYTLTVA